MINNSIIKWDGGKITKPGVYSGIPLEEYHGDITDGPGISSSGIRMIEAESALHYFDQSYLNPERAEQESKTFFDLGKAVHHLVAGEGEFWKHFAVRPEEFNSWQTKASKEWRAEQILAGKGILTADDIETVKGIVKMLAKHPVIEAGILSGLTEHSIFWYDDIVTGEGEVVRIWKKARPDNLPLQANMIVDLKTCASADPHSVRNSIAERGYHIQLALAQEGIMKVWGRLMTDFVLVFSETKRPYAINIKPIHHTAITYGHMQIKRAVQTFAESIASGEWPGYFDDEAEAGLPFWYSNKLEQQIEKGLLLPADPLTAPAEPELTDEAF